MARTNIKALSNIFILNSLHWPVMQYAPNFRKRAKYIGFTLSDEHTL